MLIHQLTPSILFIYFVKSKLHSDFLFCHAIEYKKKMVWKPKRNEKTHEHIGSLTNYKIGCINLNASREKKSTQRENFR